MNKTVNTLIGFVVGSLLFGIPYLSSVGAFQPVPYRVEYVNYTLSNDERYVTVESGFWKDGCELTRFEVVGIDFGVVSNTPFKDNFDPSEYTEEELATREFDRVAGYHTLKIIIGPLSKPYDTLEIRTRHVCKTGTDQLENVDKVYAKIELEYESGGP